jgi:hypothetical protein
MRQESAAAMIELIQANPNLLAVAGDLMVKNLDWPGAQELAERLKLTLPPEIRQAEEAKKQRTLPPEVQAIIQQFEQALQEKEQIMQQAAEQMEMMQREMHKLKTDVEAKEAAVAVQAFEAKLKVQELRLKEYDAETKRLQVVKDMAALSEEQVQQVAEQTLQALASSMPREEELAATPVPVAEEPEAVEEEDKGPDSNAILAAALQGFQEALTQLRAPRVATMPDGRQIKVQ